MYFGPIGLRITASITFGRLQAEDYIALQAEQLIQRISKEKKSYIFDQISENERRSD